MCCVKNEAEVDERLSLMKPDVALEIPNLARYVTFCTNMWGSFRKFVMRQILHFTEV